MKLSSTMRPFVGTRKAAVTIALMAGLLFCQAALAADAARFEAESMSHGSFASVVSSDGASGAKALRYENDGNATKQVVTTLGATKVVVRARNSDYSTGTNQQLRVLVDGVGKGTQQLRSRTYEDYTFSAAVPAGTHTLGVAGLDLDGRDAMLVDTVALDAPDNDAPVANDDDAYEANEDGELNIDAPGVLGNDTDADGDSLTVTADTSPAHGGVTLNANGSFTYTPNGNYHGSDSFTYTVSDGKGGTATATVNITVTAANDAPDASNDTATTDEDTALNDIAVLTNDTDADGDSLGVSSVTRPSHGTAVVDNGTTINYNPAAGYNGPDSFTYTVSDGNGGTDTATVDVTVAPDAPALPVPCDKWASPTGSDTNAGTNAAPYFTAQKLANSLAPGQRGCLKAGTYTEADKEVNISSGGNATGRVVLRTAPDEPSQARINARVVVGATADYLTLRDLRMDGSYSPACSAGGTCTILPSPTINGDYTHLVGNDISSRRPGSEATLAGICNNAGTGGTPVYGLRITGNNIHHCGRIPASNHDHGIYLTSTRGAVISNNRIYQNADRAIQFYTDADGTLVENNIMDANGEGIIFSGSSSTTSDNNEVRNNVISNSKIRWLVESYWSGPVGVGNTAHDNCLWPTNPNSTYNQSDGVQPNAQGFASSVNVRANPLYGLLGEVGTLSDCRAVYGQVPPG